MNTIKNKAELIANIEILENYISSKTEPQYGFALDLIKKGVCFVALKSENGYKFYPSRFIGYLSNTMDAHQNNDTKDGKATNPAISLILGSKPVVNPTVNVEYDKYCEKLGFFAREKGAFGVQRKFWIMSEE